MHRSFFLLPALLAVTFLTPGPGRAADRPNVILIMTDDQGYGDFGATGNPVIATPRIDEMAKRSASMRTFYVSPVCSPTRASLMTGRYNYRTRVIDTFLGRSLMEPDEVTIAEVLSRAGYRTGIFGKWHLGDNYPMRPMDQGFDESLIHLGGGLAQPSEPMENQRRYTDPILFHNGRKVATTGYCSDVYTEAAMQFIQESHANAEPFFIYLPHNAPHSPYHDVPEDLYQHYLAQTDELAKIMVTQSTGAKLKNEIDTLARIAAMITNIDQNVGRLLDHLERLRLIENTLVIFLVDNGPNTRRYVGPFRGMKSEVYEGGVRSPLWLHWPARFKARTSSDVPVAHIDLMPTILEACGVATPGGLKLDGRSFLPLLQDQPVEWPERTIALQTHRGNEPQRYHHFMIRDDRWKLLHASGFHRERAEGPPRFELYDLANDAGETNDLATQHPAIVARLKQAYDRWFDDVSGTRPDNYAPPRIVAGAPQENPTVLTRQDLRRDDATKQSPGEWRLLVKEAGRFDFTLLLEPADKVETVTLSLNGRTFTRQSGPGANACTFRDLKLESGPLAVRAVLSGDGQRIPYQIVLTRH